MTLRFNENDTNIANGILKLDSNGRLPIDRVPDPFSIDSLTDVDTTTVAPTNGQALAWQSSTSLWIPQSFSGSSRETIITTTSNAYVPSSVTGATIAITYILSPTANGTVTLTNITASGNSGLKLTFKKKTAFIMAIVPASGETIDGFSGGTDLIQQYASLSIISDGTSWNIV